MKRLHSLLLEFIDDDLRGDWAEVSAMKNEIEAESGDIDDALNYLEKNDLVKSSRDDESYRMLPRGVEVLSNMEVRNTVRQLDSSLADLQDFQARSSAVETIFTLFLLGFAFLQYYQQADGASLLAWVLLSTGLVWALTVGGRNLLDVTVSRLEELPEARKLKFYALLSFIMMLFLLLWL